MHQYITHHSHHGPHNKTYTYSNWLHNITFVIYCYAEEARLIQIFYDNKFDNYVSIGFEIGYYLLLL